MGIISSNKETNVDYIKSGDSFKMRISLSAEPELPNSPAEVVLLLDKSQSMAGEALNNMKIGVKNFIDFLDEAADGKVNGTMSETSVAVVSFSDYALGDTVLTNKTSTLKTAVDSITAGGHTNHSAAFSKAVELLNHTSPKEKIIVMFTDGKTTTGPDASDIVKSAKALGIKIYCLGVDGDDAIDESVLKKWASNPDSEYFSSASNAAQIIRSLEKIAGKIAKSGAKDVVIDEKVNSDFAITEVTAPEKGSAIITGSDSIRWTINNLGSKNAEEAFLEFTVKHLGNTSGVRFVNSEINYSDAYANKVDFPSPTITVDGKIEVMPEECPVPIEIEIDGCKNCIEYDMGDVYMESLGRVMQLDLTLKNICPEKRVALAVILSEVDSEGAEHKRGFKTAVIPAHHNSSCKDIKVRCMKFVLPEELDVSGGSQAALCNKRNFKARVIFHYIDHDFECCDITI